MAGRIDQMQHIFAPVPGLVKNARRLRLDGDAAFALKVHRVQHLVGHVAAAHRVGDLEDAVGQRRFAMIDMGNN